MVTGRRDRRRHGRNKGDATAKEKHGKREIWIMALNRRGNLSDQVETRGKQRWRSEEEEESKESKTVLMRWLWRLTVGTRDVGLVHIQFIHVLNQPKSPKKSIRNPSSTGGAF
ncbi:unnamed protein product [Microthlaspi erraticum]|uniref:Uncharacterized protein n=1 Tax=Microthlaspi erraticum TaxID=1685480 RepID=A0A6D2KP71_9BRAS|nr:unnamed protein product [Microthlaspi erraticum]